MKGFFGVIALCLMVPVFLPVLRDIIKITWASLPLWVQLAAVGSVVIVVLLVLRIVWWGLTGRSTVKRRR